jgi:hypothetical protein
LVITAVGFLEFGWIDKAGFFIPKDPQAPHVPDFGVPEFARFFRMTPQQVVGKVRPDPLIR